MNIISLAEHKLAVTAFALYLTKGIYILNLNAVSIMKENAKQLDKGARMHTYLRIPNSCTKPGCVTPNILVTRQCSNSNTI